MLYRLDLVADRPGIAGPGNHEAEKRKKTEKEREKRGWEEW